MKIKIVILTIYFALSGCAFKNHIESNDTKLPPMSARYDWKGSDSKDQYFKAERALLQVSQNEVKSASSVTLPIEIPNPLTISSDVLGEVKNHYSFSKSYISMGDTKLELPIFVAFEEGRITFHISGIASVIDSKVSSNFSLNIELFDASNKIFTYTFNLRTPPSKVTLSYNSDINGSGEGTKILPSFKRIELSDRVFNLIRTVVVKNDEDQDIEIKFPEFPNANLYQDVITYTYQDIGCNAGGYRYNTSNWNDKLTDGVIVLPLDQRTLPTLLNSVNEKPTQVVVLPPNSVSTLGIYSYAQKDKDRLCNQSLKSTFSAVVVLTDCYEVIDYCEQIGDHCHGHCEEASFEKIESEISMAYCAKKWARHSGSLNVGDQRQGLYVLFNEGQNLGSFRFNDHEFAKDSIIRSIPMFQNKESVFLVPAVSN